MLLNFLRTMIFATILKPFVWFILGLNVNDREKLPRRGPMILVSNHNSHLDTAVLMSLFSVREFPRVRPVAAADYFLKNRLVSWFSLKLVGIIPLRRCGDFRHGDPLGPVTKALGRGDIIIFYPEGTRGEPEEMAHFKKGITRLAQMHPDVPVVPIFMRGLGKALPKGEMLLVPFACDVFIGDPIRFSDVASRELFHYHVETSVRNLGLKMAHAWGGVK